MDADSTGAVACDSHTDCYFMPCRFARSLVSDRIHCHPFESVNVKGLGEINTYIIPVSDFAKDEFSKYEEERKANGGQAKVSSSSHH
jgi:hypothetical protein